jgi:hypothetical protein
MAPLQREHIKRPICMYSDKAIQPQTSLLEIYMSLSKQKKSRHGTLLEGSKSKQSKEGKSKRAKMFSENVVLPTKEKAELHVKDFLEVGNVHKRKRSKHRAGAVKLFFNRDPAGRPGCVRLVNV